MSMNAVDVIPTAATLKSQHVQKLSVDLRRKSEDLCSGMLVLIKNEIKGAEVARAKGGGFLWRFLKYLGPRLRL